MCGGNAWAKNLMSGGLTSDAMKESFTGDGLKRGVVSGGLSNAKNFDSEQRKNTLSNARDDGILPDKKVKVDPAAERAAAAAEATSQANARIAFMRKAQRDNSLVTGGGNAARGTLGV
jgi:hypothetical protein